MNSRVSEVGGVGEKSRKSKSVKRKTKKEKKQPTIIFDENQIPDLNILEDTHYTFSLKKLKQ